MSLVADTGVEAIARLAAETGRAERHEVQWEPEHVRGAAARLRAAKRWCVSRGMRLEALYCEGLANEIEAALADMRDRKGTVIHMRVSAKSRALYERAGLVPRHRQGRRGNPRAKGNPQRFRSRKPGTELRITGWVPPWEREAEDDGPPDGA